MKVDIYIRETSGSNPRNIRIPWLPDVINFETGAASMASYDILNLGKVEIPSGVDLRSCSWESIFPGAYRTDSGMLRGKWKEPSYYDCILNDWKKKGTRLSLLVIGYPINISVYLEDYSVKANGGFGDIEYSISFREARTIKVKSSKVKNTGTATSSGYGTSSSGKRTTSTKSTTYVVKSGDTLWGIAQSQLGSGSKWGQIYTWNKSIIEATAKSRGKSSSNNGHWIFPGTKLQLN